MQHYSCCTGPVHRCPRPYEAPVTPDQKPLLVNQETGSPCVSQLQGSPTPRPFRSGQSSRPGMPPRPPALGRPQRTKASSTSQGGRLQQPRSLQAHASAGGSAHPHACRLSRSRASCMDQARGSCLRLQLQRLRLQLQRLRLQLQRLRSSRRCPRQFPEPKYNGTNRTKATNDPLGDVNC
ncbi:unnamed protein product [Rangifer tarandus platyrhynchus]|uniref:Uncharacterized protein n=2 Tax=Rangifer tarandus platyrhynchus TaxID=3082113 RepID=A0ABN8Z4B9_RANTA|nr:unnamed protein product [Rangifer tarandus platyrhynchus]